MEQHAAASPLNGGVRSSTLSAFREAVHHNYGRAAQGRLVDRSPRRLAPRARDRAAVEAVRDDAALLRPPARAARSSSPAETCAQPNSCSSRAHCVPCPRRASQKSTRACGAPGRSAAAVAFASKTNHFALCVDISAAVFAIRGLRLEPAPLRAKHAQCSAPSHARLPRAGALKSPQRGLHSGGRGGSRARDAAEKSWPEVRPFDAPLAGRARLPAKNFC